MPQLNYAATKAHREAVRRHPYGFGRRFLAVYTNADGLLTHVPGYVRAPDAVAARTRFGELELAAFELPEEEYAAIPDDRPQWREWERQGRRVMNVAEYLRAMLVQGNRAEMSRHACQLHEDLFAAQRAGDVPGWRAMDALRNEIRVVLFPVREEVTA